MGPLPRASSRPLWPLPVSKGSLGVLGQGHAAWKPPVRTEVCLPPLLGLAGEGKEGNLGDKRNKNALWVNSRNPV